MAGARLGAVLRELQTLFGTGTATAAGDAQLLERFATRRDEAAFAALVARHGAMVLAVCRGVLRCPYDAEDAFQATFLILARQARAIQVRDSLAGWLHRVARRVAVQANIAAMRRQAREQEGAMMRAVASPDNALRDEQLALLHEEIGRLPEKYRVPVLLCDLEGLTRNQAAGQLGWPPGTVAGRLARGRDLLRMRLTRRGVAPAGGIAGALLVMREVSAAVPPAWAEAAVAAAGDVAAGRMVAAGALSAPALELAREAIRAMIRLQIRRAVVQTLALGLGLTALFATIALAWQKDRLPATTTTPTTTTTATTVTGIVVDDDGRPAPGVGVFGSATPVGGGWGHVVAETRTDDEGRFRLELPGARRDPMRPMPGAIWAYQPGKLVASFPVRQGTISQDVPVRLVLGAPARTLFEVRGPDGKPVAGATIQPRVLSRDWLSAPNGLAERIEAATVTRADGKAVLGAFFPEEVNTVIVSAPGLGSQQFGFGHRDVEIGTKILKLLPAGGLKGRIVGESPELVRGRELTVVIWNKRSSPPPATALVYVTTDAEGRFAIPEIAEGDLSIHAPLPSGSPWYVRSPPGLKVEAGKTTEVEIPLRKGVRVHGLVLEKGSGRPVANLDVSVNYHSGVKARTDANGRYEGIAVPGRADMGLSLVSEDHATLMYGGPEPTIPEDADDFALPTIELARAGAVRGVVVDPQDRPVAGVLIEAAWPVDEGPNRRGRRETSVRSDGRGEFLLHHVPLDSEVTLVARHLGLRTPTPVLTRVGAPEPARLRLDPAHAVSLAGRVLDKQGMPIPGARIHLRTRTRYPGGQIKEAELVDFAGALVLKSDTEGRFRTPTQLDSDREYTAFASADGFGTQSTPWVSGKSGAFPDLVLPPEG